MFPKPSSSSDWMDKDGFPMEEAEGNGGGGQWKHEDIELRGQGSGWTPI